ncbi:ABC transporter permease [Gordonia rubripertincta]|uniref:ABC transporter permease n=2 Tax=Gordonia rubripertincta TaxID=36822 RepID=A0AAW6RH74_GORRU|nr:ABC transporter permease [Gordonia rubripertincta]MDG6783643.1 ABC transporter permease [Gordonia rubripertincta]NKY65812.1 ABC transporter permease [Gordonia rubripertincta]GAB83853.1 putative ABC transporter permease protein [Gordonia rubripertincta NBRC 101908]
MIGQALAAVDAERIKLSSTRAPYWCLAMVVVFGLGVAVLLGWLLSGGYADTASVDTRTIDYLVGVNQFGVAVFAIMAVLGVTTEYRFGTIRPTFAAVPRRPLVILAKTVVFGGLTFVAAAIVGLLGVVLGQALTGNGIALGGPNTVRQLWGTPVFAMLCALIGLSVGALVRHSAGAVAIVLGWMFAFERILSVLPRIGENITPFLPFLNGWNFLSGGDSTFHWNAYGSLAYFAVFTVILLAIAIFVTSARDA